MSHARKTRKPAIASTSRNMVFGCLGTPCIFHTPSLSSACTKVCSPSSVKFASIFVVGSIRDCFLGKLEHSRLLPWKARALATASLESSSLHDRFLGKLEHSRLLSKFKLFHSTAINTSVLSLRTRYALRASLSPSIRSSTNPSGRMTFPSCTRRRPGTLDDMDCPMLFCFIPEAGTGWFPYQGCALATFVLLALQASRASRECESALRMLRAIEKMC